MARGFLCAGVWAAMDGPGEARQGARRNARFLPRRGRGMDMAAMIACRRLPAFLSRKGAIGAQIVQKRPRGGEENGKDYAPPPRRLPPRCRNPPARHQDPYGRKLAEESIGEAPARSGHHACFGSLSSAACIRRGQCQTLQAQAEWQARRLRDPPSRDGSPL